MASAAVFWPLEAIGQDIYYVDRHHDTDRSTEAGTDTGTDTDTDTKTATKTSAVCPRLIILCTWLGGATPRRIQKYLDGYSHLYPSSSILLITARFLEMTALPFSVLHARLAPARNVLIQQMEAAGEEPPVLWHVFSHGGCNTAIQMALSLRAERGDIDLSVGVGVIVFDCCPGDASFENAYRAAAYSLPRGFPGRVIGGTVLWPSMGVITGLQSVGLMRSVRDLREQLNDVSILGRAKRLYVYSTGDEVVKWEDVEGHIEDARRKGIWAEGVKFNGSPHYALVRDHGNEYWNTIASHWGGADGGRLLTSKL